MLSWLHQGQLWDRASSCIDVDGKDVLQVWGGWSKVLCWQSAILVMPGIPHQTGNPANSQGTVAWHFQEPVTKRAVTVERFQYNVPSRNLSGSTCRFCLPHLQHAAASTTGRCGPCHNQRCSRCRTEVYLSLGGMTWSSLVGGVKHLLVVQPPTSSYWWKQSQLSSATSFRISLWQCSRLTEHPKGRLACNWKTPFLGSESQSTMTMIIVGIESYDNLLFTVIHLLLSTQHRF